MSEPQPNVHLTAEQDDAYRALLLAATRLRSSRTVLSAISEVDAALRAVEALQEKPAEHFTEDQITDAISQWLTFGEDTGPTPKNRDEAAHGGYFSGPGWAARCLRYHLEQRKGIARMREGTA